MTPEEIVMAIRENIIQGRRYASDEGLDGDMMGTPGAQELTEAAIEAGIDPGVIITQALKDGMNVVGEKFETKEYFLPDMLVAAEAVEVAMKVLEPYLEKAGVAFKGKIIMATVKGDLHDIGKSIVSLLLRGDGYEVIDLGTDVEPSRIAEAVAEEKPDFLGLSALLTTPMRAMEETIRTLEERGLRDKVRILVGGAPLSAEFACEIKADAYCIDGFQAIQVLDEFLKTS